MGGKLKRNMTKPKAFHFSKLLVLNDAAASFFFFSRPLWFRGMASTSFSRMSRNSLPIVLGDLVLAYDWDLVPSTPNDFASFAIPALDTAARSNRCSLLCASRSSSRARVRKEISRDILEQEKVGRRFMAYCVVLCCVSDCASDLCPCAISLSSSSSTFRPDTSQNDDEDMDDLLCNLLIFRDEIVLYC